MATRKTSSGWQVDLRLDGRGFRRARRTFETKGFKVHTVPITPELAEELPTRPQGRLLRTCYMARTAVKRAGIELPRRQCAHVLRHNPERATSS
ncbi:site-specific integrase [Nitrococcus mobilis]|uniref:Phage integrase n=1 Tax=Nitrococcus mobilis Nb-231 TaxID=314278 RepID=A4BPG5_9GAMM|nr:hypothetical protein [Nitrococcus mobilis]EAR22466.1 phage integrase [Nitrococcus mobilis Nb-231]